MNEAPIRVGIIGVAVDRGWAANAHLPALKALPQFALHAVCTTRQESADAVARAFDVPHAFADWRQMVVRPDIDLVVVCVKVGEHIGPVLGALAAGKHVFCEWPLGLDVAQAEAMRDAARQAGVRNMVGLQGRVHPVLAQAKAMIADGRIGEVISATLTSSLASWGPRLPPGEEYRADQRNGATALTIPGGHSLDSLTHCLGPLEEVSAWLSTQHGETEIIGTGRVVPVTSPDQLMLNGRLASGAMLNVHIKADMAVPMGVRLEINGRDGDLLIASRGVPGKDVVGLQRAELVLSTARRGEKGFTEVAVPDDGLAPAGALQGAAYYTGRLLALLARGIRAGEDVTPDFADAVACQRMLEVVARASATGERLRLG